jgi:hypothetical protein
MERPRRRLLARGRGARLRHCASASNAVPARPLRWARATPAAASGVKAGAPVGPRETVGSAGGAWFRAARAGPTGSGFLPPPRRSVRAVLPHTAHRRPFTGGIRLGPPVPEGAGCDDESVEVDQSHAVRRHVGDDGHAVARCPLVALGHEQGQPPERIGGDPGEVRAAVPIAEVVRPAAREPVELLHDHFDRVAEPLGVRDLTDPIAGPLHCLS